MTRRLAEFYTGEQNSDIPPLEKRFNSIPPDLLEPALRVLEVSEAFPNWTITQILEQPVALLDAVVTLKSIGLKMRQQVEDEKKGKL